MPSKKAVQQLLQSRAERFRRARESTGHTQVTAAEVLGVSSRSIGRYESGESPVPRWVEMAWRDEISRALILALAEGDND